MPATIRWVGGSGDWNTPANWSGGVLPGPNDDAVISVSGITVTHSSGTHSIHSLDASSAFVLPGGTLTVSGTVQDSNTFTLSGGTLSGATVASGTTIRQAVGASGRLNGVTLNGDLSVLGGASGVDAVVSVTGGLTVNGTVTLAATGGGSGRLRFDSSQTLAGSGAVVFGSFNPANALWLASAGVSLTIGPAITVRGQSGTIGVLSGVTGTSVVNQGTISADDSTGTAGTIVLSGASWSNRGTIRALNGGTVTSGGVSVDATGVLSSRAPATLNISGNLIGTTQNADQYAPSGTLVFNGAGTPAMPQLLEVMSHDLGNVPGGFAQFRVWYSRLGRPHLRAPSR